MTGEISYNDLKDYPDILNLARDIQKKVKVSAQVKPFDKYQGPYIAVCFDRKPIRKNSNYCIGFWNISVWQSSEFEDMYVMDWKNVFSSEMYADELIDKIKEIKETYVSPYKKVT